MKPVILVTRKLPDAVEDRLRRDHGARLNPEDVLYSRDELIERARDVDAILPVTRKNSPRKGSPDCPGACGPLRISPRRRLQKYKICFNFVRLL